MKQFLRYQISGSVFIFWIVVFYFGQDASSLVELIENIYEKINGTKSILGLISALPIGVLIHQVSVQIKNWLIGKIWKEFNDYPKKDRILNKTKSKDYILDRISNLNSFYYVRFDNGILAPLFAYLIISSERSINPIWICSSLFLGIIISSYIVRIKNEIQEYDLLLMQEIENV